MEMNLEGARIHWWWAPHLCVVLGARVGREASGCSPMFLPWASQVAVGHLPSGVNPSLLGIARKRHFGAEGEEIAVSWAPSSRPKPFTHRGLPWLCSTRGRARRPGYTPAAERMPQPLAAGEAAGKGSCCCCCCCCCCWVSCVWLFATPWDAARQASLSMGFPTLEWVAISFSRESSGPSSWTRVSHTAGRFSTPEPPRRPLEREG